MIDMRTDKQRERDALHSTIINEFIKLRSAAPEASNHRRMETLAKKYRMTAAGIRRILLEKNIITKK